MKLQLFCTSKGNDSGGFTLPEVSIAVAVCMIGMVGLLALLPNALKGARDAVDHTQIARIIEGEFAQYRAAAAAATLASFPPLTTIPPWGATTHYYDANGNPCLLAGPAYFAVYIIRTNRAAAVYGSAQISDYTARVQWPIKNTGSSNPKVTEYFVTSIARHERP